MPCPRAGSSFVKLPCASRNHFWRQALSELCSAIQFRVTTEDAVLIERDAPFRREVSRDVRTRGNAVVQSDQPRIVRLQPFHGFRKCIAQAGNQLKYRQIGIGQRIARHVTPALAGTGQYLLEITKKFRHALGPENFRTPARLGFLLMVVERTADRMMRVVNLRYKIGNRELQLVDPDPTRFVSRREAMARPQVQQDIGGLADDALSRFKERWRIRSP